MQGSALAESSVEPRRSETWIFALTILLSSFLLFQVQPIMGRRLLPLFGGAAGVWGACLAFFQGVLLIGYYYSHWSTGRISRRGQPLVHIAILAVSLLSAPLALRNYDESITSSAPSWAILLLLVQSVGVPYFALCATSPLVQTWYARSTSFRTPYWLFAVSNGGSLAGLLIYPFWIEPRLTVRNQELLWSAGYGLFVVMMATLAWRQHRVAAYDGESHFQSSESEAAPGILRSLSWLTLAACPSVLLLAITNHICRDVAPVPLLWVLPLALYLITFMLCFDTRGWYRANLFLALVVPSLAALAWLSAGGGKELGIGTSVGAILAGFFVCCMFCHGELARLKPAPRRLTDFYVMVSFGGAAGAAFVAFAAPLLFRFHAELPLSLLLCSFLAVAISFSQPARFPLILRILAGLGLAVSSQILGEGVALQTSVPLHTARSFYGSLKVVAAQTNDYSYRALLHGSIIHGKQADPANLAVQPSAYYCEDSGVGLALGRDAGPRGRRVAVIGLGIGTVAAYGRPGDSYYFYELDPLVGEVADAYFTYLRDSKADVTVRFGDGRLAIEALQDEGFDVLIADAFSSDAIPTHLLTLEAIELYFRRLNPGGIVAIHISNNYVDLEPVLAVAAETLDKAGVVVDSEDSADSLCSKSKWVLLAREFETLEFGRASISGHHLSSTAERSAWTDDYSNLLESLKK